MELTTIGLLGQVGKKSGAKAAELLLGLESEREKQLKRIERKVDAQLKGPYVAALLHLKKAQAPGTSEASASKHLDNAESKFIDALGNLKEVDPLRGAWAAVYIVGICLAQGKLAEATDWAFQAHELAVRAVQLHCTEVNNKIDARIGKRLKLASDKVASPVGVLTVGGLVLTGAWFGIPAALVALGVAGGGVVGYRDYMKKRGNSELNEMDRFVVQIGDLIVKLGTNRVPTLYRIGIEKGDYFSYKEWRPRSDL